MNNLKQIQEENRKAIICAVHGTDDYEEALEKDKVLAKYHKLPLHSYPENWQPKPLTLDRVLLAFRFEFFYVDTEGYFYEKLNNPYWEDQEKLLFRWNLTKPTLEEQIEETQRAINKILNK